MTVVLLVESDGTLRDLYEAALREDGYEVISACGNADALAKNLLHRPDVVVMDPHAERGGLDTALELTRVNRKALVIFNTRCPLMEGTDFSSWVADALSERCGDPTDLRRALRQVSPALAGRPAGRG